ncbi:MAG: hypothetical protein GYA47_06580 [Desulfovibrio sp.]|nr:hypothetical protein [Desulfovibrio sp.]
MDSFFSTLLWVAAALVAALAVTALALFLRARSRLPQDFDFEHYKRIENR